MVRDGEDGDLATTVRPAAFALRDPRRKALRKERQVWCTLPQDHVGCCVERRPKAGRGTSSQTRRKVVAIMRVIDCRGSDWRGTGRDLGTF